MLQGSINARSSSDGLMLPVPFAWYEADYLGLQNNDPVTVWFDKGPNGLDAVQISTNPPIFRTGLTTSGLPAVSFVPTNVLQSSVFAAINQPATIFAVWFSHAAGRLLDGENNGSRFIIDTSSNMVRIFAGNFIGYTRLPNFGRFVIHTGIFNGANSQIREDGQLVATGNAGNLSNTRFTIGAHHAGTTNQLNAYVAEIIIYDRLLTQSEIEYVESYLYKKYFIAQISGQIDSNSDLSAGLSLHIPLSSSIVAVSDVTAMIKVISEIWGSIVADSDSAAELSRKISLTGQVNDSSDLSAELYRHISLRVDIDAVLIVNGNLKRNVGLESSVNPKSDVTGRISLKHILSGEIIGQSDVSGNAERIRDLRVNISIQSDLQADLFQNKALQGSINCISQLNGNLNVVFILIGHLDCISGLLGFLDVRTRTAGIRLTGEVVKTIYLEGEVVTHG